MKTSDKTYDDLSDKFFLETASKIAAELRPVFERRHFTSMAAALVAVENEAELAQEDLSLKGRHYARSQSSR